MFVSTSYSLSVIQVAVVCCFLEKLKQIFTDKKVITWKGPNFRLVSQQVFCHFSFFVATSLTVKLNFSKFMFQSHNFSYSSV